jgi:hypothetical protein
MAKTIHPRIKQVIDELVQLNPKEIIHEDTLRFLNSKNVTQTEAVVALHLGYNFAIEQADDFVRNSTILKPEDIQDTAYYTLLYMFYDPDDPNYRADDDMVRVPI